MNNYNSHNSKLQPIKDLLAAIISSQPQMEDSPQKLDDAFQASTEMPKAQKEVCVLPAFRRNKLYEDKLSLLHPRNILAARHRVKNLLLG